MFSLENVLSTEDFRVPADTGRPGHLLNALCTFNLRPVPTGRMHSDMKSLWILLKRLYSINSLSLQGKVILKKPILGLIFDIKAIFRDVWIFLNKIDCSQFVEGHSLQFVLFDIMGY